MKCEHTTDDGQAECQEREGTWCPGKTTPTSTPTTTPTTPPTPQPTLEPTFEPTTTPTLEPTALPTLEPTTTPTQKNERSENRICCMFKAAPQNLFFSLIGTVA